MKKLVRLGKVAVETKNQLVGAPFRDGAVIVRNGIAHSACAFDPAGTAVATLDQCTA